MKQEEYKNIFENEEGHWWYSSLRDLIMITSNEYLKLNKRGRSVVIDAGCGTGGILNAIRENYRFSELIGLDISSVALQYCRMRGLDNLLQASVEYLPFRGNSIDALISLDVLYHADVSNDDRSLRDMFRVIKSGGYLFLHLPAFKFLKGSHDVVVHTKKRYTIANLYTMLDEKGFKVVTCTYRYFLLFPLLFIRRLLDKFSKKEAASDLQVLPHWMNRMLYFIFFCENRISRYVKLPIGSSIFCVAQKQ